MTARAFACRPECGRCCTQLERPLARDEARALRSHAEMLRDEGVYSCGHATRGLSLTPAEAAALRARSDERGLRAKLHPRTYLLETRRRLVVALDWHLDHASCPFHEPYRCTVYEDRPLVCRAFPVLAGSPSWTLAPLCPETEPTLAARDAKRLTLRVFHRAEADARRALDARDAALDDAAMRALVDTRFRFARGWSAAEAKARARAWRVVTLEELEACTAPARSSTS